MNDSRLRGVEYSPRSRKVMPDAHSARKGLMNAFKQILTPSRSGINVSRQLGVAVRFQIYFELVMETFDQVVRCRKVGGLKACCQWKEIE